MKQKIKKLLFNVLIAVMISGSCFSFVFAEEKNDNMESAIERDEQKIIEEKEEEEEIEEKEQNEKINQEKEPPQKEKQEIEGINLFGEGEDWIFDVSYSENYVLMHKFIKLSATDEEKENFANELLQIEEADTDNIKGYVNYYASITSPLSEAEVNNIFNNDYSPLSNDDIAIWYGSIVEVFNDWCENLTEYNLFYGANYRTIENKIEYVYDISQIPDGWVTNTTEISNNFSFYNIGSVFVVDEYEDFPEKTATAVEDTAKIESCGLLTYELEEWNTEIDGSGISFVFDEEITKTKFYKNTIDEDGKRVLKLYPKWRKLKILSIYSTLGYNKYYDINETFDPTGLEILLNYDSSFFGGCSLSYNADLEEFITLDPSSTTPLLESDTKVKLTFNDIDFRSGGKAFVDIPVSVGLWKTKYNQNLPSSNWDFIESRVSRETSWEIDFEETTSIKETSGLFRTPLTIKGRFIEKEVMIGSTDANGDVILKKLSKFNTQADGSGTDYSLGQILTSNTTDYSADRELQLYAIWEDVANYKFYICYIRNNKEMKLINYSDPILYFDELAGDISTNYVGFYDMGNVETKTEEEIRNEYNSEYSTGNVVISLAELKERYLNWTNNATNSVSWGAKYNGAAPAPAPAPTPIPPGGGGGGTGNNGGGGTQIKEEINTVNLLPKEELIDNRQLITELTVNNNSIVYVNVMDSKGNKGYGRWLQIPNTYTWYFLSGNPNTVGTEETFGFVSNGWYYISWKGQYRWYHFDKSGVMQVGWFAEDKKIYYLQADYSDGLYGRMFTGTNVINGVSYNFGDNGALVN